LIDCLPLLEEDTKTPVQTFILWRLDYCNSMSWWVEWTDRQTHTAGAEFCGKADHRT